MEDGNLRQELEERKETKAKANYFAYKAGRKLREKSKEKRRDGWRRSEQTRQHGRRLMSRNSK